MKEFNIEGKKIGTNSPIFLIAEVGVNHNGDLSLAKKLVDLAAQANFDSIKFQSVMLVCGNLVIKLIRQNFAICLNEIDILTKWWIDDRER